MNRGSLTTSPFFSREEGDPNEFDGTKFGQADRQPAACKGILSDRTSNRCSDHPHHRCDRNSKSPASENRRERIFCREQHSNVHQRERSVFFVVPVGGVSQSAVRPRSGGRRLRRGSKPGGSDSRVGGPEQSWLHFYLRSRGAIGNEHELRSEEHTPEL